MLRVIWNKSWKQYPTKQQLYAHLPPISKTIQIRRTRHTGHSWRSKNELISDVLQRTPSYGRASVGRPTRSYQQQLSKDTGCSLEDRPEAMDHRDEWWEGVKEIHASSTTWRCWWFLFNNLNHMFVYKWTPCSHMRTLNASCSLSSPYVERLRCAF